MKLSWNSTQNSLGLYYTFLKNIECSGCPLNVLVHTLLQCGWPNPLIMVCPQSLPKEERSWCFWLGKLPLSRVLPFFFFFINPSAVQVLVLFHVHFLWLDFWFNIWITLSPSNVIWDIDLVDPFSDNLRECFRQISYISRLPTEFEFKITLIQLFHLAINLILYHVLMKVMVSLFWHFAFLSVHLHPPQTNSSDSLEPCNNCVLGGSGMCLGSGWNIIIMRYFWCF